MKMIGAVLDWLTSPQGNVVVLAIIVGGLLVAVGWKRLCDAVWPVEDEVDPDWPGWR